ncbi:MAG: AbrB/MazE/SpoVT family DNA-binding domain-containing protein [Nanoarchaeota archaeon]|nr:AbrB/MazE/SpoVT family DNA-binding domain-containing protein [Nanoarchaeota archaeon]MBU1444895.1 AbrB/MazE/SpoVT family DNA-binding domain-containing protein [Nanoarchaeota archaeon]MBU2420228.1 AbrB/MazE/SpoVT family DNA-binding domain-containing protein [Nanoarchaeota archaeon]MBU2475232.1 AbrB/MazE/SpoVT family DNA-binding domain-containing protein [Nanoarchaeota archaeon]MBU3941142.1 AbrB/MazE/SpoVT family DNA-binding domain-containing protein [Nanoarchaeota archaeon]
MEIDTTTLGERGQIVIPQDIRQDLQLRKGEKFIIVRTEGKIILEPMKNLKANVLEELREDLIDLKIAERFWEEVKTGKAKKQSKAEFLKDFEKW